MAAKFLLVALAVVACSAFPADEVNPPSEVGAPVPSDLAPPPAQIEPAQTAVDPAQDPQPPIPGAQNPEGTDLKTDSSSWWRRSYFPIYRSWPRSYYYKTYYPRSYGYYGYSSPYWSSWW